MDSSLGTTLPKNHPESTEMSIERHCNNIIIQENVVLTENFMRQKPGDCDTCTKLFCEVSHLVQCFCETMLRNVKQG